MKKFLSFSVLALAITLASTGSTFAQSTATATATTTTSHPQTAMTMAQVIAKGDKAIADRISKLNKGSDRVANMKYLTADQKAAIQVSLHSAMDAMTQEKATLDASVDLATAKANYESIFQDNRIYKVVMPQERVAAMTESFAGFMTMHNEAAAKLQTRIDAAKTAGKDTTLAQTKLDEAKAKLADAAIQSTTATTAINALAVDYGDKIIIASNKARTEEARTAMKAMHEDIKTARTDIKSVTATLKSFGF